MKNTFGNHLSITLFGESHGPYIGAVLDGLAPGITIDHVLIRHMLTLRRPAGKTGTARVEEDRYEIVSGVYQGKTTGTPLCILIENTKQNSADYDKEGRVIRPGHADYTAYCKYHGFEDYHGGGHFSGRITAALVAAGAIASGALRDKNITIGTHILSLQGIRDRSFEDIPADIAYINEQTFPVFHPAAAEAMEQEILSAAQRGDSVGGTLESAVYGMEAGVGEPWFDSVESLLSHALFSIPAVKGVQFGLGFDGEQYYGSEYNDPIRCDGEGVYTTTNHNGGIGGGITNGMPIIFRTAVKPTPSVFVKQDSIDIDRMENTSVQIRGRHDPAIIHRARVVVDSVTALVLYDLLSGRFGTDYFMP
ncbi:MAG: chorismate synthase [Lachnospiraceae bacterium]|nr:chorismate synthase [Lachnospiraceae bacterium]